jgi:hypothetical protein
MITVSIALDYARKSISKNFLRANDLLAFVRHPVPHLDSDFKPRRGGWKLASSVLDKPM